MTSISRSLSAMRAHTTRRIAAIRASARASANASNQKRHAEQGDRYRYNYQYGTVVIIDTISGVRRWLAKQPDIDAFKNECHTQATLDMYFASAMEEEEWLKG